MAAFLLLLVMGGDVIACEFLSPGHFESFRVPGNDMRLHQSHDHCICCCTHIVAAVPIVLPEPAGSVDTVIAAEPYAPMQALACVYHPPRV